MSGRRVESSVQRIRLPLLPQGRICSCKKADSEYQRHCETRLTVIGGFTTAVEDHCGDGGVHELPAPEAGATQK